MFKFFSAIAAFIDTIVNFVINVIQMMISLVINIGRSIAWLVLCLSYLPPWLVAFVMVPISLAVIFQILNKGD